MNGFSRLLLAAALVSPAAGHDIHAAGEETVTHLTRRELFSGKPPICPRWAFGPWLWEENGNTQDSTLF